MGFGETLLYDLSTDLAEQHSVADLHPEIVEQAERYMDGAHVDSQHWKAPKPPNAPKS